MEATRNASLTPSELARWLGRPYPTVARWRRGSTPGLNLSEAWRRIELLNEAVRQGALPLPSEIRRDERLVKLRELYANLDNPSRVGSDLFDIYSAA
jgi:hypothetical protein